MTELPCWTLDPEQIQLASAKGFDYTEVGDPARFRLSRKADDALIWPHIDGFISTFIRQGTFVRHKKYRDLDRVLARRFGDNDNE